MVIPELIQGRDALIQFKAGTGKTHAFLFGLLWHFDPADDALQYIYISTSHEVATQIYEQAVFLLPKVTNVVLCIGQKKETVSTGGFRTPIGTSTLNNRFKTLKEERDEIAKAQVIVCTVGKFYDYLCNRKIITSVQYLKSICIDEFDNIISSHSKSNFMNTEEQVREIMKIIPRTAQRTFFSATALDHSAKLARGYFRTYSEEVGDAFIVLLDTGDYTLESIRQYYVKVNDINDKKVALLNLLKKCHIAQGIIFTNRIDTANDIKMLLDEQEVSIQSAVFHGNLPTVERKMIHNNFIANKIRLLISTDLTARGLDINGLNIVINFDMPDVLETYIHRVGRSGRYGKKGVAISLVLINNKLNEMIKVASINEYSKYSKLDVLPTNIAALF